MFWLRTTPTTTTLSALAVTAMIPVAVLLAPGAGASPPSPDDAAALLSDSAATCCAESLPEVTPEALPEAPVEAPAEVPEALTDAIAVAHVDAASGSLPAGVAPERGLQVRTILVERNVTAAFPQIHSMIGVRPDSKPWHPNGLAVDIIIPNPGSPEGIALGNAIRDYALSNAGRFGVQDVIWRGTYYTPAGPSGSGYGHFDHVHITTTGGGYPTGGEEYPRIGI